MLPGLHWESHLLCDPGRWWGGHDGRRPRSKFKPLQQIIVAWEMLQQVITNKSLSKLYIIMLYRWTFALFNLTLISLSCCHTGGLTSPFQLFSSRMERLALMESIPGLMHQCYHTYGRLGTWKKNKLCTIVVWFWQTYCVIVLLFQYTLATECFQLGYNVEGHCKGEVDSSLPRPQRLNWEIPSEVRHPFTYFP